MADEPSKSNLRVSSVLSRNFESRRVDGVAIDTAGHGTVSLAFYVVRTPLTGWTEYEIALDGNLGNVAGSENTESGVILEYQQEILLGEEEARLLRDELNEMLGDEKP